MSLTGLATEHFLSPARRLLPLHQEFTLLESHHVVVLHCIIDALSHYNVHTYLNFLDAPPSPSLSCHPDCSLAALEHPPSSVTHLLVLWVSCSCVICMEALHISTSLDCLGVAGEVGKKQELGFHGQQKEIGKKQPDQAMVLDRQWV